MRCEDCRRWQVGKPKKEWGHCFLILDSGLSVATTVNTRGSTMFESRYDFGCVLFKPIENLEGLGKREGL